MLYYVYLYDNNVPVSIAFIVASTIFSILFGDIKWFQECYHESRFSFYFSPTEKKKIDGVNLHTIDGNGDLRW
jgi:hypothetical protein